MRVPIRIPVLISGLAFGLAAAAWAEGPMPWLPLFDGRSLDQWSYAKNFWRTDSGMLVGQGKSPITTFCHTARPFSDFVLSGWTRLWETSAGYANSGIQYRSRFIDSLAHRMQGYQWDIGGGFDGSILPEGGFPMDAPPREISEACRATIRKNGWNHVVITADQGRIRHELNGVTCLEYQASVAEGYIGLQLPATNLVMKVDFRDLYIRPLNGSFAIPDSEAVFLDGAYATRIAADRYRIAAPAAKASAFSRSAGAAGMAYLVGYPGCRPWRADARGRALPAAPPRAKGGIAAKAEFMTEVEP